MANNLKLISFFRVSATLSFLLLSVHGRGRVHSPGMISSGISFFGDRFLRLFPTDIQIDFLNQILRFLLNFLEQRRPLLPLPHQIVCDIEGR
jgi:hypothetical protein